MVICRSPKREAMGLFPDVGVDPGWREGQIGWAAGASTGIRQQVQMQQRAAALGEAKMTAVGTVKLRCRVDRIGLDWKRKRGDL